MPPGACSGPSEVLRGADRGSAALSDDPLFFALEGEKMVEAVAGRVAIGFSGRGNAAGNHLLGLVRVVRARFLSLFAGEANGLVVEDRKSPSVLFAEGLAAARAAAGTGQFFLPMRFHPKPPLSSLRRIAADDSVLTRIIIIGFEVFKGGAIQGRSLILTQWRGHLATRPRRCLVRRRGSYPFGMFAEESRLEFDLLMRVRYE